MSALDMPSIAAAGTDLLATVRKLDPGRTLDARKAEQAAKDFESVLLHKVLEEMDRTIPESGLLDSGVSKQVKGMFQFYLAQELANRGGIGLWKDLQKQLGCVAEQPAEANVELRS